MFKEWNPSPSGKRVGDCAVRALSKALNKDWETTYTMLAVRGMAMNDMPNSNAVINSVLTNNGFIREVIPNSCPDCYTIGEFAEDHPHGTYVLGTGDHVVCVSDGGIINDSWDSSNEIPIYYWKKTIERGKDNGLSLRDYDPNDPNGVLSDTRIRPANHLD